MNEQYYQKKNNRRAFLLLVVLGFVGFLGFKFSHVEETVADFSKETEESSCVSCNGIVDNSYEQKELFLRVNEQGEINDVTPNVLSATSSSTGCSIAGNTYSGDSVCEIEKDNQVSVDGKNYISTSSEVNLVRLDIPVVLFSGKYTIKDSNRELTIGDPVYKPVGEITDKNTVYKYTPPGEESKSLKEQIEGVAKKIAYDVNYTLSIDGGDSTGKAQVNKYIPNRNAILGNTDSNANPAKSNLLSSLLLARNFSLPVSQYAQEVKTNVLEVSGMCNEGSSVEIDALKYPTRCMSIFESIAGVISRLFPKSDWSGCTEESETCINSENIVVKLSPILEETNSYLDTVARSAQDPTTASTYNAVYVITDCQAEVAGSIKNIQCIWDLSYLFHERFVAEFDDLGGSETPTSTDYINYLKKESATRDEVVQSM